MLVDCVGFSATAELRPCSEANFFRWGGDSFQFNYNSIPLGQIDCVLPALSGMAIDFHEGGNSLAQSYVDNFRVEVCAQAP